MPSEDFRAHSIQLLTYFYRRSDTQIKNSQKKKFTGTKQFPKSTFYKFKWTKLSAGDYSHFIQLKFKPEVIYIV